MIAHGLPGTITGLRHALAARSFSIEEALDAQFAHVDACGSRFRCVVHAFATPKRHHGGSLLSGVGLAHKDIFNTGERYPACGRLHGAGGSPPGGAAAVIAGLEHAGAANLAALTMAEYACGATGESLPALQPVNPLDSDLAVGGSSSGSAVAVAAGLCYASLATDTAGSVRIPAATCGVLGLKTTQGLIPCDGVFPLAPSLDTVGILARSAADAALILAALGHDRHRELLCAAAKLDGAEQHLLKQADSRVGVAIASHALADDVALALEAFVDGLAASGPLTRVAIPALQEMTDCAETLLHVEAAHVHWERLRNQPSEMAAPTRAVIYPGAAIPALWYREALTRRAAHVERVIDDCFRAADIVLVPALANPLPDWSKVHSASPSFDAKQLLAMHRWMPFVNYLGFPSVVFPVGVDARNHPVSMQAIGRPFAECALLSFAYRVERERHGVLGFALPKAPASIRRQSDLKVCNA